MATTKVNSEFIAVNAISGTIIADGAITSTHLAANCVDTAELVTGSIDTIHIAANQVTAAKIVSDGVEHRHMHSNVISGLSTVTAVGGDYALIGDTSDSNNLKKALISDFGVAGISSSADATAMTITSGEHVLIGVSSEYSGTSANLTVKDAIDIGTNEADEANIRFTRSASTGVIGSIGSKWTGYGEGSVIKFHADNVGGGSQQSSMTFHTNHNNSLAERMRINSSGNVGIGTDSPSTATPLTAYYSGTSQFNIGGPQSGISNNVYYNGSAYVNRNTSAGGALLQMGTDGTFAMRRATSGSSPTLNYSLYIDANGVVSAPAGIALGLGEAVTTASNVIDDYEEGTWTPAFYTYSGVTTSSMTVTLATYTKIGNICHIHANVTATLSSLPGQTVTITGLPFAASGSDQYAIIALGGHMENTGGSTPKAHFRTNGSQLDGVYYNASNNTAYWTYQSFDSPTFHLSIHGFYTTA